MEYPEAPSFFLNLWKFLQQDATTGQTIENIHSFQLNGLTYYCLTFESQTEGFRIKRVFKNCKKMYIHQEFYVEKTIPEVLKLYEIANEEIEFENEVEMA